MATTTVYEILGVVLLSFGLNLIPFAGPSNILIAFNASLAVEADPVVIGAAVALGSASAKLIHYLVTFFVRGLLPEKRRRSLEATGLRLKHWASLAVFLAAATPIPDDPVVVPLGLMRYSPTKLFLVYFAGKLLIATVGAYLGQMGLSYSSTFLTQEGSIVVSLILTVVITIVLLRVDTEELMRRLGSRLRGIHLRARHPST
jgi:membrane protein DedA with SNARE-associated domain